MDTKYGDLLDSLEYWKKEGNVSCFKLIRNIDTIREALAIADRVQQEPIQTGLKDKLGRDILIGHVVHWTDGGDDLPLSLRVATRWDRIAVVSKDGILPQFTVIDSPSAEVKRQGHTFSYGSFIYKDTENHLTIVADSIEDYRSKFQNAGECMAAVLSLTELRDEKGETK